MPSDFLSNLSSKALQHSEVDVASSELKPRLASLFENMNAPAGLVVVDQVPDTKSFVEADAKDDVRFKNIEHRQDRDKTVRTSPIANEGIGLGALAASERRIGETNLTADNLLKPMTVTGHWEASRIKPIHTELSSPAHTHEAAQQPKLSAAAAEVSPYAEAEKTIKNHTISAEIKPISINPEKAFPASTLPEAPPSSKPKVVPERIEVTRLERQSQAPSKASQIVPALLPKIQSPSRMPETPEQPPTIHVTIGRIEVKAATPALAPKRGTPASPTMSLDEYLRRRSGGDR
jgi:hypothetical protein